MSDETDIPEDELTRDDLIAAELSLGLLVGEEQTQAERRARIDRRFGDLVEDWDMRFAQMTDDIAPVAPPKGLFRKITNEAYPDSPKRLWQQLGIIPAFLSAGAAALVLIAALQFGPLLVAPTPIFEAEITAEDQSITVAAAFIQESRTLSVEWTKGERIDGRDVELWLIEGGNAPVSLGVLNKGTPLTDFVLSDDLQRRLAGGVLAVSDEPLGGSPTGAPTGDILAVGTITAI